jgi:hypothetical protein
VWKEKKGTAIDGSKGPDSVGALSVGFGAPEVTPSIIKKKVIVVFKKLVTFNFV